MKLFAALMLLGLSATPALAHPNHHGHKHNHCHLHQKKHIFHCHKHGVNSNHHGDLHHTRSKPKYRHGRYIVPRHGRYIVPFLHIEIN